MASNLRDRLRRIQNSNKTEIPKPASVPRDSGGTCPRLCESGWESAGYQTLKQIFQLSQHVPIPPVFPAALPLVIPDLEACFYRDDGTALSISDLLFFDLETTGLSGGAGTVAFLAAFGRLVSHAADRKKPQAADYTLHITQYLLLDYPGESDFLDAVCAEFTGRPLVVSYNGKTFDAQILKTRCLMNGMRPPQYLHADLLHPARRLWKRLFESCSQGNLEEKVLGLDRSDDVSGAMAPDIWFDFLRTTRTEALMEICDHNRRDIRGLASLFAVMAHIAVNPVAAYEQYQYDAERLSLRWHDCSCRPSGPGPYAAEKNQRDSLLNTGTELLYFAAEKGWPRSALVLALYLLRSGFQDEGRRRLRDIACGDFPEQFRVSALPRN
jgi:uncharacterized protein YprB with RNaseH-like and TPR domain